MTVTWSFTARKMSKPCYRRLSQIDPVNQREPDTKGTCRVSPHVQNLSAASEVRAMGKNWSYRGQHTLRILESVVLSVIH